MQRRQFLASLAAPVALAQTRRKPNIIFILADDLGIGDIACYGGKVILTPNIDRLAAEGMRFANAYAGATVCAPSRNCLLTGQHTGHTTVRANHSSITGERVPIAPSDVTVAEVLKETGYVTGIFGKWGLGEPGTKGLPNLQGFEDWFGFLNQDHAVDYYTDYLWRNGRKEIIKGNLNGARREYAQDLFTREAVRFIQAHRSQPFFLYLPYTTPHLNHEVPDLGPYADKPWTAEQKTYAAMVTRLDRDVGRIIDLLKRTGLDDDTLVIFSSDNGAANKNNVEFFRGTLDFRAAKSSVYEGGIRVPAIARWPGKVPSGKVSDFVWAFWDFLPTVAELAGARAPRGLDGISIVPALTGKPQLPHEYLYWEAYGKGQGFQQAIRMGNWKAVRKGLGAKLQLYDLASDHREQYDVAAQHPDVVARITAKLKTARTDNPEYPVDKEPVRPQSSER